MNNNLANKVINFLKENKLTISTAESLTGGGIASELVKVSGASEVFKGSVVAYDLSIKEKVLGISKKVLKEDAVNQKTATKMAKSIVKLMDSDIGVSTTGIAESYDERPPMVYYTIYYKRTNLISKCFYSFATKNLTRNEVREKVTELVFKEILKIFNY